MAMLFLFFLSLPITHTHSLRLSVLPSDWQRQYCYHIGVTAAVLLRTIGVTTQGTQKVIATARNLEAELLLEEEEGGLAGTGLVDGGGRVEELVLQEGGQRLLGLLTALRVLHLGVGDESLGLQVSSDAVTSRHDVRVVHELHERLHAQPLGDLLLGHGLADLQLRLLDTSDQAVAEGAGLGAIVKGLDDDTLLTGEATVGEDHDPTGLDELTHFERSVLSKLDKFVVYSTCL